MPPGSSNGTGPFTVTANPQDFAEAYANTAIPSGLQVNSSFNITLWASDGTTKQTESVPVVIKASCKRKMVNATNTPVSCAPEPGAGHRCAFLPGWSASRTR